MINIYDSANQLEQNLRKTEEYQELEKAYSEVKSDEASYKQFKEFQKAQMEFQSKQAKGELTDSDVDKIKSLGEKIEKKKVIMTLMEKERKLAQVMDEINQIMFKPVNELYQD
ncbi:YlbF family regulator [Liquorilactobacillus uvarum]|uniref:YlbF family regulator n=1 Tax=Liquorilactobacillus uvarum TaxID=303240 RepID=UPI00288ACEE1|nr:YlbF family regulator [Liquorilactobacillus uvarum]